MSSIPVRPTDEVEDKVLDFIKTHGLFEPGQTVLIAVSGGADSMCLLHTLLALRERLGIKLHVAHLDHMLRGSASRLDASFVTAHSRSLGLNCTAEARNAALFRETHSCSLEEAARELRYAFLADIAHTVGASVIAAGHTRDDSVETMILHLLRGSGIHGLRGLDPIARVKTIAMARDDSEGILLARPLLSLSSEETRQYCQDKGLQPRSDSSNESLSFLRNRVRLELLPWFEALNPRFDEAMLRLAIAARDDDQYLADAMKTLWATIASETSSGIHIDVSGFAGAAPALQARVIHEAVRRLNGSARNVGFEHLSAVRELIEKPAGKFINLPDRIIWRREHSALVAMRTDPTVHPQHPVAFSDPIHISVPGKTSVPGWQVSTGFRDNGPSPHPTGLTAHLDAGSAGTSLFVRCRRQGDRFRPLGMSEDKRLQDFMVDAGIPANQRDAVPLLCADARIAWVVGWRIDDSVKVTADTRTILHVEFTPDLP